jgi:hypothetical protein
MFMESAPLVHQNLQFGQHKRVNVYAGIPDYRKLLLDEISGKIIQKTSVIRDEKGQTLVMGRMNH